MELIIPLQGSTGSLVTIESFVLGDTKHADLDMPVLRRGPMDNSQASAVFASKVSS